MSVKRICNVEGCGREHAARGYCCSHYAKFRREGKLEDMSTVSTCTVVGCNEPLHGKGLCVKHYRQKVRTGSHLSYQSGRPADPYKLSTRLAYERFKDE